MPRVRSEKTIERENKALGLRREGLTYREISGRFGWASTSAAHQAVTKALAREPAEDREVVRKLELEKYDAEEVECWQVLRTFHYVVISGGPNAGTLVRSPSGEFLRDSVLILAALGQLLRIHERRARLLGLDEPRKTTVTVVTEDVIDAEIRRLEAEVAQSAHHHRSAPRKARAVEGASA